MTSTNSSSQHGEDEIVRGYFPADFKGSAVEVGAGDGVLLSNTLWMERAGWKVLCIEPHPDLYSALAKNRALARHAACSDRENSAPVIVYPSIGSANHGIIPVIKPLTLQFANAFLRGNAQPYIAGMVKVVTLDRALEDSGFTAIDFVSIDTDGNEAEVLRGFQIDRWRPRVVMVENPFKNDEIDGWFLERGYYRDHAAIGGFNDIYVKEEA